MQRWFTYGFVLLMAMFTAACENNMAEIKADQAFENIPVLSVDNFEMMYSDSGVVRAKITAPRRDVYEGKNPYTELPKGMKIIFYDSLKREETKLTARYGLRRENEQTMEARYNVVVTNIKDEKLETERLVWDEKTAQLSSDAFVKITTPKEIIFGEGFVSNETFTEYKILKVSGTKKINE